MKAPAKAKGKLSRGSAKPSRKRRHIVKALAAQGVNTDVIAAYLGINKNQLRAEHALDLHAGRVKLKKQKAAAAAAALSKQDARQDPSEFSNALVQQGARQRLVRRCPHRRRGFSVVEGALKLSGERISTQWVRRRQCPKRLKQ
jgi:hypothetical protein